MDRRKTILAATAIGVMFMGLIVCTAIFARKGSAPPAAPVQQIDQTPAPAPTP